MSNYKLGSKSKIDHKSSTVSPRIGQIEIVQFDNRAVLFLVQKFSNSAIPRNSAIILSKKCVQIVRFLEIGRLY